MKKYNLGNLNSNHRCSDPSGHYFWTLVHTCIYIYIYICTWISNDTIHNSLKIGTLCKISNQTLQKI